MRSLKDDLIQYITNFGSVDSKFRSDFKKYTDEHRYQQSLTMAIEMLVITVIAAILVFYHDGFNTKDDMLMLRYFVMLFFVLLSVVRFIVGPLLEKKQYNTYKNKNLFMNVYWIASVVGSLICCYSVAQTENNGNLVDFVVCIMLFMMTIALYTYMLATANVIILVAYSCIISIFVVVFHWPFSLMFYTLVVLALCIICAANRYMLLQSLFEEQKLVERSNDRLQDLANEAVKKANEANASRSDFLARISHDMRTPMNGILGMIHLTEQESISPVVAENLQKMEITGKYLLSLINDLLDYRKLEDGSVLLKKEPTDTTAFLSDLCREFETEAERKQLELSVSNTISDRCLNLDKERVHQLITNIFSNAVNFTEPGGSVTFSITQSALSDSKTEVVFSVSDNGIGMSEDFLAHIFEPFSRENLDSVNADGMGLGMAIVKIIVEALEGSIEIESNKGKGTKVTVRFVTDVIEANSPDYVKTIGDVTTDLNGKRILICEDNPLNREIATKLLESKGVIVECADNGKIGVDMFNGSQVGYYSMILMDIRMPVMNGYEATKAIRGLRRKDASGVPIVAMSANAFREDIQESLKSGMNAHMVKPIVIKEFYSTIQNYIALYEKQMSND